MTFGPSVPAISRSMIVHDPFDEEAFDEILPKAAGLRLLLAESEVPLAQQLAFDLFCSFYKYVVKLRSPAEIAPECQGHRDLLSRALDLREHEKLRAFTRLKPTETALATELFRRCAPVRRSSTSSKAATSLEPSPGNSPASRWRNGKTCSTRKSSRTPFSSTSCGAARRNRGRFTSASTTRGAWQARRKCGPRRPRSPSPILRWPRIARSRSSCSETLRIRSASFRCGPRTMRRRGSRRYSTWARTFWEAGRIS